MSTFLAAPHVRHAAARLMRLQPASELPPLNDLDRFHLVMDVIDRVPGLAQRVWPGAPPPAEAATDTQRGQPA
jgi:hypothetical protein